MRRIKSTFAFATFVAASISLLPLLLVLYVTSRLSEYLIDVMSESYLTISESSP